LGIVWHTANAAEDSRLPGRSDQPKGESNPLKLNEAKGESNQLQLRANSIKGESSQAKIESQQYKERATVGSATGGTDSGKAIQIELNPQPLPPELVRLQRRTPTI
jgi:hypothetical protein